MFYKKAARLALLCVLVIFGLPMVDTALAPYDYKAPHSDSWTLWWGNLGTAVHAQLGGDPPCDCTESKPKERCPDPDWGPCTSYVCKFTNNLNKKCKTLDPWPLSDPYCLGCLRAENVACERPPECPARECF